MPSEPIVIPGSYCVQLKPGVSVAKFLNKAQPDVRSGVTDRLENLGGFNGHFKDKTVKALRADPDVDSVGRNVMMHLT